MATIEKWENSGAISYRVKIRIKGKPAQTATFERLTDAKDWAKITEGAIKDGKYFRTKRKTLADLIDRCVEHTLPQKPKAESKQKTQLLWWKDQLMRLKIKSYGYNSGYTKHFGGSLHTAQQAE